MLIFVNTYSVTLTFVGIACDSRQAARMLLIPMTQDEINVWMTAPRETSGNRLHLFSPEQFRGCRRDTRSQRIGRPEKFAVAKARKRASPLFAASRPTPRRISTSDRKQLSRTDLERPRGCRTKPEFTPCYRAEISLFARTNVPVRA